MSVQQTPEQKEVMSVSPNDDDTEIRSITTMGGGSGTSLYSNIPAAAVEAHGFEPGQSVMVKCTADGILIVPFK